MTRYGGDGQRGKTFSRNGMARVDLSEPGYTFTGLWSCTRTPGGKIVALLAGTNDQDTTPVVLIAHFRASGRLNRAFGDNGVTLAEVPYPVQTGFNPHFGPQQPCRGRPQPVVLQRCPV